MKIKKGQVLQIEHRRKGAFVGVALVDFDTAVVEYFPVAVAKGYARGLSTDWSVGQEIPCRACFVQSVEVIGGRDEQIPVEEPADGTAG